MKYGKDSKTTVNDSPSKDSQSKKEECVTVVVRCRPMSEKEKLMGHSQVVEMWPDQGSILIRNPKEDHKDPVKTFTFDAVYDWNSTQQELYEEVVRPLVESVLNGFNATIFAYGQTGTGKTYTMEGRRDSSTTTTAENDERGVIPKSFEQIFTHISRTTDKQHLIRASYLEIYQEEVRDLLDKDPKRRYELRESKEVGVYVKGLQSFVCKSVQEIEQVMSIGNRNRTIGATNMNEHSSRSHAIFMITVEMRDLAGGTNKSRIKVGKLNLVDLAGSERQAKTGASGDRLKEASKINLSLSALGNVISALVDEKCQHIPYRDSKLTRLLQDSLGGNSKTLMVANIGPASYNYDETLTTLRYANRAKNIQNQPRVNEDPKEALIREYQEEIERLKMLLAERIQQRSSNKRKGADDGSGNENWGENQKEYFQREEDKLEQKKAGILMKENDISEEERQRQLKVIEEKRRLIEEEKMYSQDLAGKIKSMESQLLQGGKNIIDHTNQQQRDLEKRMAEITERKLAAIQMQKKLDEVEESAESIRASYSTLLEEVEAKKKQLNKIVSKYQRIKQEIADSMDEHNQNRRELEMSQKEILKDMKLHQIIIDNFIPPQERSSIESRLLYDEDDNVWRVMPDNEMSRLKGRLVANPGFRRPISKYTMDNIKNPIMRFRGENIVMLDLDRFEKIAKEYERPSVTSSLKVMLESALKGEEDLDIDINTRPKPRIPVPASGYTVSRDGKRYPQARGLVPPK